MQRWRFIRYVTVALVLLGARRLAQCARAGQERYGVESHRRPLLKTQPPRSNRESRSDRPWCGAPTANPAAGAAGPVTTATAEKEFKYFAFLSDPAYTTGRADRALGRAADRGGGAALRRCARQSGLWSRRGNGKDARSRRSDPAGSQCLSRPAIPGDRLAGLRADRPWCT